MNAFPWSRRHPRAARRRGACLTVEAMEERLAARAVRAPTERSAYHAITYGWLVAGLARRVSSGRGLAELVRTEIAEPLAEHQVFRPAADRAYSVDRTDDHTFRVSGKGIERLVARYDLDNDDALAHLERRLRGIGVISALEAAGFEPGDEVEIAGIAFDLDPE